MKKLVLAGVLAAALFGGTGVANADVIHTWTVPDDRYCPEFSDQRVTQFFTAPDTCTRIYHR
jgi:hypothetical protein